MPAVALTLRGADGARVVSLTLYRFIIRSSLLAVSVPFEVAGDMELIGRRPISMIEIVASLLDESRA